MLLPTPTFCFKQDLFRERGQLGTKIYQTASQPVPLSPARNSWNEAMQLFFLFVRPWPIFSRLLYKTNPLPHFSLPLFKGKKQTDLPKLRQNTVHSQVLKRTLPNWLAQFHALLSFQSFSNNNKNVGPISSPPAP